MEIVGQLNAQMVDMVGGVVETVGEEPEPESEDNLEQHEDEDHTRVNYYQFTKKTKQNTLFLPLSATTLLSSSLKVSHLWGQN